MRVLVIVAAILGVASLPALSEEAAVVCFSDKAKNMEALVKQGDHAGADLFARLHCWEIRPPARHPLRGTDKWTPFPNLKAMGERFIFYKVFHAK